MKLAAVHQPPSDVGRLQQRALCRWLSNSCSDCLVTRGIEVEFALASRYRRCWMPVARQKLQNGGLSSKPLTTDCIALETNLSRWGKMAPIPAFKLACGRLPDTGTDRCSQPTISRWENAPALRDLIRLMGVMVDLYCNSYATPPAVVTLDIDDIVDVVHGHQQLSFFNAHYDERCFLPIHVRA
jgi:hypothetical protein